MGFWEKLLKDPKKENRAQQETGGKAPEPGFCDQEIPGTLNLGWYWSGAKEEFQMAKVSERDRAVHFYVIGATGTGKTKFLEFLVQQDIENGNGFGVIDPHGDLIEDIKGFLACRYQENGDEEEIAERVILIDPANPQFTVTFNPLEKLPNVSSAEQANELVDAFKSIWSDGKSWGVRMEDLLRNTLIALSEAEMTIGQLPLFFTDKTFRTQVLEKVENPISLQYFQRFNQASPREQSTWIEPVMNKINAFLADERIRQIFSSKESSFNLRKVMDNQNILLIKLDKGKLKGAADLLGSLLMAKIQLAAFSRSDIPQSKRVPFYLYIDEFQNFASESFSVVLSEARKYGLSLIMAHQTLAQIPPELRSLVLGNTGIQVYFRINRQDAKLLATEGFEYSGYDVKRVDSPRPVFWSLGEEWEHHTEDLQTLPPRLCYAKHKIEGGIIPLRTVEIEPAWQALEMGEDEYRGFLKELPFGSKYLVARESLTDVVSQKPGPAKGKTAKKQAESLISEPAAEQALNDNCVEAESSSVELEGQSQHKQLQESIRQMAEERGFKAIVEQMTPDGLGRVDISLEKDRRKIACEVSVTTSGEQELLNIEKCLVAGYEKVLLCSPEKKSLSKIKTKVSKKLKEKDKDRVVFLQPEEIPQYLDRIEDSEKKETKAKAPATSEELWEERIWDALRHLDDRSILSQSPLARLAYIEKLTEKEYKGNILSKGLALKEVLIKCIDRITAEGGNEPGLQKTCEFLRLLKEGLNLTAIGEALGMSREQATRVYKKKAVKLVTQEFLKVVKTRRTK